MKTIKTVYYGSRLSENMTYTPDDFLVCHNVPIARLGSQTYLGREIGMDDLGDSLVTVERREEEVFSPGAMASFEGKPFTNEHPPGGVNPDNATHHIRGMVHTIRRGKDQEKDLLLADIIVYDKEVIKQIEAGKREVSCGYNCLYEELGPKHYNQVEICGNHVALVQIGRAGGRVAIKDHLPREMRRKKTMSKIGLWGKMVKSFAQDATPEEMEQALDEATKACNPPGEEPPVQAQPPAKAEDEGGNELAEIKAMLQQLLQALQPKQQEAPPTALDSLEAELMGEETTDSDEEESATIEAENLEARQAADTAALLQQIAVIKPVIARISNPAERKMASDTMASVLRKQTGLSAHTKDNAYGGIYQAAMNNVKKQTKDSQEEDLTQLGKKWRDAYNPHYQKEAK